MVTPPLLWAERPWKPFLVKNFFLSSTWASRGEALSFFPPSSSQHSLFRQENRLPHLLTFWHVWTAWSCISTFSFLRYVQPSWTSFATRTAFQGKLSTSLLNQPNSALQKSKGQFCWPLSLLLWEWEIHFVVMEPKTALSHQPFSLHHQQL